MHATRRLSVMWLLLSAITLVSWWIGARHGKAPALDGAVTFGVLAIAAVKVRMIMRDFMETRTAPRWLRWITDSWLAVLTLALLTIYFRMGATRL